MNKHISALLALIMGALIMTSCLKSDDSSEIIYYNDTAITAFSLATVNRYIHTTSKSGKDSVYKKTLSNPSITFFIDQYNKTIYNTDSLYADCDLSHVLASITSKNSGVIAIKSMISDTLRTYSSTDSLDFSKTREIRVYAQDGQNYRAYQVTINKHQVVTDKLIWEQMPVGSYPVDEEMARWEQIVEEKGLARFIGAGTKEAYAYNQEGRLMVTKDNGATWTADELDDSTSLLPKESVAFVSYPFSANEETDYQILTGVIEEGEIACSVWRKIAEYAEGSEAGKWAYVPVEAYNRYYLPATNELSLVWFHGSVLAISSSWILRSRDGGITWKGSEDLSLPADNLTSVEACSDDEGALWLKDKNSDSVWRGVLVEE